MHAPRSNEPRGALGRVPGPLRARIAQRHQRETPGAVIMDARSTGSKADAADNDRSRLDAHAS
jgi:hypothetical protein